MKRLISLCLAVLIVIVTFRTSLMLRSYGPPNPRPSSSPSLDSHSAYLQSDFLPSDSMLIHAPVSNPPTLFSIAISPEARVKATATDDRRELVEAGWTTFQLTIDNAAGITAPLVIECNQIMSTDGDTDRDRWLRLLLEPTGPLTGEVQEMRLLRLYSRDSGIRTALLNVNAGQGTQDLGFRSDVLLSFRIEKNDHSSQQSVP